MTASDCPVMTAAESLIQIQNTFVHLSEEQPSSRSGSEPPRATCDRSELHVHALMFRQQPLNERPIVYRSGQKLQQRPQLTAIEIDADCHAAVSCEGNKATTPNSADPAVRRSKVIKFQERPRLPALQDHLPFLDELDLAPSAPVITHSDDEDTIVSTVSSGSSTTVPDTERWRSNDSIDSVQLSEESMESLLKRVPKNEKGEPMSIGSVAHVEGTCKPCVFAHSQRKTCESGIRCLFCHYEHVQQKRQRQSVRRLKTKDQMAASQPKDSTRIKGW